jgi:hypothetical protein
MPRSMGDPNYKYRPMSDEARSKLSAAHRKRLGVPDGHHLLYGVLVPNEIWSEVARRANYFLKKHGREGLTAFVQALVHDPEMMR